MEKKTTNILAVFGGSFDPIHYGHLASAQAVLHEIGAENCIFVPTGNPPHKKDITSAEKRLEMTKLAVSGSENFIVSDIEVLRNGISFTIDTIRELNSAYDAEIVLIIGSDTVFKLKSWYSFEELFKLVTFAVAIRPGFSGDNLEVEIKSLRAEHGAKIRLYKTPGVNISSSEIRDRIKLNKPITYLLPKTLEEYIIKTGIYDTFSKLSSALDKKYPIIMSYLKSRLSKKRMLHTLGVTETATRLAEIHGFDADKAELAALCHDCAKWMCEEMLASECEKYSIAIMPAELLHSYIGAEVCKTEFGIFDEEVLSAIRKHTTGANIMTGFDRLIYVSDIAEPTRQDVIDRLAVYRLAEKSIDEAFEACLKIKHDFTISKGKKVY